MDNQEKLINAFAEALSIETIMVTDNLMYQGIEQWDSISHMILISQLEEVFDVSIDTNDVIDMSSVAKAREILIKYNIKF